MTNYNLLKLDIRKFKNFLAMGLLSDMGPLLSFEEGDKLQPVLKNIAIRQFLKVLNKYRKWKKPSGIQ